MNKLATTENKKHPGGRPTSCTRYDLAKARFYVTNYSSLGEAIPTINGMALHIGVTRRTLYNWIRNLRNEEFLRIYEDCMSQQEIVLINKGLVGEFNASFCTMMLTKHGYGKKQKSKIVYSEKPSQNQMKKLDILLRN